MLQVMRAVALLVWIIGSTKMLQSWKTRVTRMFTQERAHWLYRHFLWLEENLPPRTDGSSPAIILPSREFYPQRNTRDHAFAEAVFQTTRDLMGLAEWPCRLIPQSDEEREAAAAIARGAPYAEMRHSGPAGTFSVGDEVEITYSPALLNDPPGLVATLAHELCHYLMAAVKAEPPCGWSEHEPLTDLAAVHEGFGVFLCNNAFHFTQWSNATHGGWQTDTRGYLNEAELGFSLGIFCTRRKVDPELLMRHLKPNPGEVFWDSLDYIEQLERT
jgi:hypothetical protein